jgi:hypothetical protein
MGALLEEELSQRTAARPNFDDGRRVGSENRSGDALQDGAVGEEVLAEAASQS